MEAWSPQLAATEENKVCKDMINERAWQRLPTWRKWCYRGPGQATVRSWPKRLLIHRSVNVKSIGFEHVPKSDSPCAFQACWKFPHEELLFARTFLIEAWSPQFAPTWENDACKVIFNGSLKPPTCSYVRRTWCSQGHFKWKPETLNLLPQKKIRFARTF